MAQPSKSYEALIHENRWRTEGHDYVDNERMALLNDSEAVAAYREAVMNGCCGSVDTVIYVDGEPCLYGFNYGH